MSIRQKFYNLKDDFQNKKEKLKKTGRNAAAIGTIIATVGTGLLGGTLGFNNTVQANSKMDIENPERFNTSEKQVEKYIENVVSNEVENEVLFDTIEYVHRGISHQKEQYLLRRNTEKAFKVDFERYYPEIYDGDVNDLKLALEYIADFSYGDQATGEVTEEERELMEEDLQYNDAYTALVKIIERDLHDKDVEFKDVLRKPPIERYVTNKKPEDFSNDEDLRRKYNFFIDDSLTSEKFTKLHKMINENIDDRRKFWNKGIAEIQVKEKIDEKIEEYISEEIQKEDVQIENDDSLVITSERYSDDEIQEMEEEIKKEYVKSIDDALNYIADFEYGEVTGEVTEEEKELMEEDLQKIAVYNALRKYTEEHLEDKTVTFSTQPYDLNIRTKDPEKISERDNNEIDFYIEKYLEDDLNPNVESFMGNYLTLVQGMIKSDQRFIEDKNKQYEDSITEKQIFERLPVLKENTIEALEKSLKYLADLEYGEDVTGEVTEEEKELMQEDLQYNDAYRGFRKSLRKYRDGEDVEFREEPYPPPEEIDQ